MIEWFSRTEMLIGKSGVEKLKKSKVIIFGIGGVGSFTAEALARAGIGKLILVDNDKVALTNINRQIHALNETVGRYKTEVMKERILNINPLAEVCCINEFVLYNNVEDIIKSDIDYIIDAVDTVTAKIAVVKTAKSKNIEVISCMGTGNKFYPELLEISDIYKTSVCPLSRVMRHELKKNGIDSLTVVYSKEKPILPFYTEEVTNKRNTPGSISFVPSCAGLIIAGFVVRKLLE